jgi:hypothetical protein
MALTRGPEAGSWRSPSQIPGECRCCDPGRSGAGLRAGHGRGSGHRCVRSPGRRALLCPWDDARRRAWNGSWNGVAGIPVQSVLSVRFPVSSVLLVRSVHGALVMVSRRSTVRFRNGLQLIEIFRTPQFQDQVTNSVMRLQLTASTEQVPRHRYPSGLRQSDSYDGVGRCASPLPGERRRHALLADEFTYAGLVEPVRSGWPCRPEAKQPTAARRRLLGASEYDWRADQCRAVGMGESVL